MLRPRIAYVLAQRETEFRHRLASSALALPGQRRVGGPRGARYNAPVGMGVTMIRSMSSEGIVRLLKTGWGQFLDLVYPPHCVVCGSQGEWLCGSCVDSIVFLEPPICQHCGRPMSTTGLCRPCRNRTSHLAAARSLAYHEPPLRDVVHALKYEGLRELAKPLCELLAGGWPFFSVPVEVIVPVPLHRARLRQRGYNQSSLLAQGLGRRIGLAVEVDALLRLRNTRSQVGLSPEQRWNNVQGAFTCPGKALQGCSVLLIDDVYTTGATLEACAQALIAADVAEVWALTLVRAATRPSAPSPKQCVT